MFVKLLLSWVSILFLLLIPLEIVSSFIINKNLEKGVRGTFLSKDSSKYLNYINQIHHVRDVVQWSSFTGELNEDNNLLFSRVESEYINKNKNLLLINGDSWAEMTFWKKAPKKTLIEFSNNNNTTIVSSGISSFSLSPMTVQLRILRNDFNIKPQKIISFFDYTDFGDELCRYKSKLSYNNNYLASIKPETYESKEVYSDLLLLNNKFNIFYNDGYYNLQKLIYYAYERIKFEFTKKNLTMKCGWSNIAKPLINGLKIDEIEHINLGIENYLNEVFSDNITKKLFIILHPHRNHFYKDNQNDKYSVLWKPLIEDVIKNSKFNKKIIVIDFMDYFPKIYNDQGIQTKDIFIETDISSHLIEKAHDIMLQKILNIVSISN